MATGINTILNWFKTGLKPTQEQFWASWTSFWHKDDKIPTSSIEGLDTVLNSKAEKDQLDGKTDKGGYEGTAQDLKTAVDTLNNLVSDLQEADVLTDAQITGLQNQINGINTLLTSNDVNLDSVQEIVDAIKTVESSLSTILVNDLTTGGVTKALTAEMGKTLNGLINALTVIVGNKANAGTTLLDYGITDALRLDDVMMPTNNFGGRKIYINSIDNAMYSAGKKWSGVSATIHSKTYGSETYPKLNPAYSATYSVTGTGNTYSVSGSPADITVFNQGVLCILVPSAPVDQYHYTYSGGNLVFGSAPSGSFTVYPGTTITQYIDSPVVETKDADLIFNGFYEDSIIVPIGYYLKVRISPSSDGHSSFGSMFYPYGTLFLSYYYTNTPLRAEYRNYNYSFEPHGIGWKVSNMVDYIGNSDSDSYIQSYNDQGNFGRSIIEFIIYSKDSGDPTRLTDIDWKLTRPNINNTGSVVNKFGENKLYYKLKLGTATDDNIILDPNGEISAKSVKVIDGLSSEFLKADGSRSNIKTIGGVSVLGSGDIPVQITITTSTSITNATTDINDNIQHGKNVIIDNGVNTINYTVNAALTTSFVKHGTGTITFVQGTGRTLVQVDGTAVFDGAAGSTATIASVGATDYLRISNT